MLWVSSVCKKLENVERDKVLAAIDELPPDLHDLYKIAFHKLCRSPTSKECALLLQVMMLAFRPLRVQELHSDAEFKTNEYEMDRVIDRSISFVNRRGEVIEFIHKSARDYLADVGDRLLLTIGNPLDHDRVATKCLLHLTRYLKPNLLGLSQLPAIREVSRRPPDDVLLSLEYAAVFWSLHLEIARDTADFSQILTRDGLLDRFFNTQFLEWIECLSLCGHLLSASQALDIVSCILNPQEVGIVGR